MPTVLYDSCRRVGGAMIPAKGVPIGATHKPMAEYRRKKAAVCGRHRVEIESHYDGDALSDAGTPPKILSVAALTSTERERIITASRGRPPIRHGVWHPVCFFRSAWEYPR